jgi:hypothetical protein
VNECDRDSRSLLVSLSARAASSDNDLFFRWSRVIDGLTRMSICPPVSPIFPSIRNETIPDTDCHPGLVCFSEVWCWCFHFFSFIREQRSEIPSQSIRRGTIGAGLPVTGDRVGWTHTPARIMKVSQSRYAPFKNAGSRHSSFFQSSIGGAEPQVRDHLRQFLIEDLEDVNHAMVLNAYNPRIDQSPTNFSSTIGQGWCVQHYKYQRT